MTRRRLIALAAAGVLVLLVAAPFILRRSSRYYTDGAGLRSDARAARPFLRDVLWEPAIPAPGAINAPDEDDYEPRVSPDGSRLVFTRGRPGFPTDPAPGSPPTPGGADLWIAERDGARWTAPRPFEEVNSPADEMGAAFGPVLSHDPAPGGAWEGLALFFSSDRPGGEGGYDIWVSVRGEDGSWSAPANLGPTVNTPRHEISPLPDPGGTFLYFATDRGGRPADASARWRATLREAIEPPDYDIHRAARIPGEATTFGPAERIDSLDTVGWAEGSLALSPRGELLYFASNRPGGRGGFDIYRARIIDGAIGPPENLGPGINTAAHELDPALASGGFELYFARGQPGVRPDDILVSTSREVILRSAPGEPYWSLAALRSALFSILRRIDPAILALLLSILAAIIFAILFGKRMARLGLLARCIILALFVHLLLALWMNSTKVHRILIASLPPDEEGLAFEVSLGGEAEEEVSFAIRTEMAETGSDAPPALEMALAEERPAGPVSSPFPAIDVALPETPARVTTAVDPARVLPPILPRDLAPAEPVADATLAREDADLADFAPDRRDPGREAARRPAEPEIDIDVAAAPDLPDAAIRAGPALVDAPPSLPDSSFQDRLASLPPPEPAAASPLEGLPPQPEAVLERDAPDPDSRAAESLAAARDAGPPPVPAAAPSPSIARDMAGAAAMAVRLEADGAFRDPARPLEPGPEAARPAEALARTPLPAVESREMDAGTEAASSVLPRADLDLAASGPSARPTEPHVEPSREEALEVVARAVEARERTEPGRDEPPAALALAASTSSVPVPAPRTSSDPSPAATREPAAAASPVEALLRSAGPPSIFADPPSEIAEARRVTGEAGPVLASEAAPGAVITLREPPPPAAGIPSAPTAATGVAAASSLPRGRIPDAGVPAPGPIAIASEAVPAELAPDGPAPRASPTILPRGTAPESDRARADEAPEPVSMAALPPRDIPPAVPAPAIELAAPGLSHDPAPGEPERPEGPPSPRAPAPRPSRETTLAARPEPLLPAAAASPQSSAAVGDARAVDPAAPGPALPSEAAPRAAIARREPPPQAAPLRSAPAAALEAAEARSLPRGAISDAPAPAPSPAPAVTGLLDVAAPLEARLPDTAPVDAPLVAGAAATPDLPAAAAGARADAAPAIDVARKDAPSAAVLERPAPPPPLASPGGGPPAPAIVAAAAPCPSPSREASRAAEPTAALPSARPAVERDPPGIARSDVPPADRAPPAAVPPESPTIAPERAAGSRPPAGASAGPAATLAIESGLRTVPPILSRGPRLAVHRGPTPAAAFAARVEPDPRRPGAGSVGVPATPASADPPVPRMLAVAPPPEAAARPDRDPPLVLERSPVIPREAAPGPATFGAGPAIAGPASTDALPGASGPSGSRAPAAPSPGRADIVAQASSPDRAPRLAGRVEAPEPASGPPDAREAQPASPAASPGAVEIALARSAGPARPPASLLQPAPLLAPAAPVAPRVLEHAASGEPLPAPSGGRALAALAPPPDRPAKEKASPRQAEASSFVPRVYQLREKGRREEAVKRGGGSPETERAVERGLLWLAVHQSPDGRWSLFDYAEHLPRASDRDLWTPDWNGNGRQDARGGSGRAEDGDTAATGLAVLAFLGHGDTHTAEGPFQRNVKRGLDFLVRSQRRDGDLRGGGNLYMHAIAAFAICEAYALTRDPALEEPSRRAVGYTLRTQNPDRGGWRYEPYPEGRDVDTSVFGWMLMALKSARVAGIEIAERPVTRMVRYLESARMTEAGGRYAYQPGLPRTSLAMTAQGFFCQQMLSEIRPPRDDEETRRLRRAAAESVSHLLRNRPARKDQDGANFYYWYYASLALFQEGGEAWTAWNERLKDVLLELQLGDDAGTAAGSWDPLSRRAKSGGRVYSTAMSILCLEVYYRYAKKEGGG